MASLSELHHGGKPPQAATNPFGAWFVALRQRAHPGLSRWRRSTKLDALRSGLPGTANSNVGNLTLDVGALLAAVAQQRDRAAFSSLFSFYSPRLKGHLLARGAASAFVEEIVQEVMLAVWHKAAYFDATRGTPGAWIFTLARNAFIDRVRREHRPAVDPSDPLLETQGSAPDQLMLDSETQRELAAAVDALPPEQRRVVERSYFQGQSLAQISASDGLPIGTVKTRARLALSRLRAIVTQRKES